MRCPRFEARHVARPLAVALILLAAAATVIPFSSPAGAAPKGKLTLAWHAGFASRWLDPQEHDGTATPDNFFTALHDALIKNQGMKVEMEAFDGYYRPVHAKQLTMISVPEAATRVAMLERGEADIIYNVPGELITKVRNLPGVTLAPVLSGSFLLESSGQPATGTDRRRRGPERPRPAARVPVPPALPGGDAGLLGGGTEPAASRRFGRGRLPPLLIPPQRTRRLAGALGGTPGRIRRTAPAA